MSLLLKLKLQSLSKSWYLILSSQFYMFFSFFKRTPLNCINFRLHKSGTTPAFDPLCSIRGMKNPQSKSQGFGINKYYWWPLLPYRLLSSSNSLQSLSLIRLISSFLRPVSPTSALPFPLPAFPLSPVKGSRVRHVSRGGYLNHNIHLSEISGLYTLLFVVTLVVVHPPTLTHLSTGPCSRS